MKIRFKTLATLVLLCAIAVCAGCTFVACKEDETEEEYSIKYCYIASDMPSNTGTIEWLDANGKSTAFVANKPCVILLSGISIPNSNDDYSLPSDIYYYGEGGVLSQSSANMHTNTAWYWSRQGFNVGVFHAECFTSCGTAEEISAKATKATAMSYINTDGIVSYSNDINYSLAELLCVAWENTLKSTPMTGSNTYGTVQEVRLIANYTAAELALATTEMLFEKYENGNVSAKAPANRITLTSPYFTDNNIDCCTATIASLAEKGVVFEIVKKPDECAGLSLNEIYENSSLFEFRETYSSIFDAQYSELHRTCLDWYLYSVNGSDYGSLTTDLVTNTGLNDTMPMLDKINGVDGTTPSMNTCRYALSAWTPTVYMRALRGVKFVMKGKFNAVTEEYPDYTLQSFASECFQFSDYSGWYIAGYAFLNSDNSLSINYGYNTRMSGIKIGVTIKDVETGKVVSSAATTESDGFYKLLISETDQQILVYLNADTPSSAYGLIADKRATGTYETLSKSHISTGIADSSSGSSITFTSPIKVGQIIINNCAFKKT